MTEQKNSASFTGHRVIPANLIPTIKFALEKTIISLVNKGVTSFYSGGACGWDLLAAEKVIAVKIQHGFSIKLIMVLPCREHGVKWSDDDKSRLIKILKNADEIIYLSEKYYDGCMKKRNEYLVEHSDFCVAYMVHGRSGTSQTVRLAREHGLEIINLA